MITSGLHKRHSPHIHMLPDMTAEAYGAKMAPGVAAVLTLIVPYLIFGGHGVASVLVILVAYLIFAKPSAKRKITVARPLGLRPVVLSDPLESNDEGEVIDVTAEIQENELQEMLTGQIDLTETPSSSSVSEDDSAEDGFGRDGWRS